MSGCCVLGGRRQWLCVRVGMEVLRIGIEVWEGRALKVPVGCCQVEEGGQTDWRGLMGERGSNPRMRVEVSRLVKGK